MNAGKKVLAVALLSVAQSACAQGAARDGGHVPIWPRERQHELAGDYAGTLRDYECGNMTAMLTLDTAHHYLLTVACTAPRSPARTLRGKWWVDEIGGSCLILDHEDGEPKQFGFRISDDATDLLLDGGDCTAADELDRPHMLKRTVNQ